MTETETKAQAYHRLLKEDRWEEASAYRIEKQCVFRAMGKSPDEARALSWLDTIAHFPPTEETLEHIRKQEEERAATLAAKQQAAREEEGIAKRESNFVDAADELDGDPDDPESINGAEVQELIAKTRDKEADVEADIQWAYHNMGRRDIRPTDAPSYGAWSQLDFAKKNRPKFIEMVNKVLGKAVIEKRKSRQDDSLDQYEMIRRFKIGVGIPLTEEEVAVSNTAAV